MTRNTRGIVFVLIAMLCATTKDVVLKNLTLNMPPAQILMIISISCSLLLIASAKLAGDYFFLRESWRPLVILRALCDGFGAVFFITTLAKMDMSKAAIIAQAQPLSVAVIAVLFMGERLCLRRWFTICVGFIGVVFVIGPGKGGFDANALLPLAAVVCFATRDLITKTLSAEIPSRIAALQGFLAVVVVSSTIMISTDQTFAPVELVDLVRFAASACCMTVASFLMVIAFRTSNASVISPFRFSRLVFAIIVGYLAFGETPCTRTLIGAALIFLAGVGFATCRYWGGAPISNTQQAT